MADHPTGAGAPALSTNIESGKFDEKAGHGIPPATHKEQVVEEEEDEDMDALIDDLESNDGHADVSYPTQSPFSLCVVAPNRWLQLAACKTAILAQLFPAGASWPGFLHCCANWICEPAPITIHHHFFHHNQC